MDILTANKIREMERLRQEERSRKIPLAGEVVPQPPRTNRSTLTLFKTLGIK